ncbi:hypothetical protein MMC11_008071 [Xylographa trunciseda]|nr:hypothetical protein [Xylographa trunciseda]
MSTLPSPPFVPLPSIHKLRSIGSHPTPHPSRRTRPAYIYRSASPSHITPADLHALASTLHITHVFDLRSTPEIASLLPLPPFPATTPTQPIRRVWAPVFAAHDYSPDRIAVRYRDYASGQTAGFVRAYADILAEGRQSFRQVLEWIREGGGVALLHCTAGKDRTGVLVMLLLGLVGVPDEDIAAEYALTEKGLEAWKPEARERLKARGMPEGGIEGMMSSMAEYMLATLDMVREKYGGVEEYVRDVLGFGDEDIATIRKNLVEDLQGQEL